MNTKNQETIADIVAEIRRQNPETFLASPWCYQPLPNKMRSYADRIEAAAKREREAGAGAEQICGEIGEIVGRESAIAELKRENERIIVDAQRYIETVSGKYGRLVKKLRSENARLREALKYMLEVNREDCDCLSDFAIRCMNAVNKTTRIYREGCDK